MGRYVCLIVSSLLVMLGCSAQASPTQPEPTTPTTAEARVAEQTLTVMVGGDRFVSACDGHGHRVFIRYVSSGAASSDPFQVIEDASCSAR